MTHTERIEKDIQNVINMYKSGISMVKIADMFNCNSGTVYYVLSRYIDIPKRKKFKGKAKDYAGQILKLYDENVSCYKIALLLNMSEPCVLRILRKNNRDTHRYYCLKNPILLKDQKEKIIEMYNSGMSGISIGKSLGYSSSMITESLKKWGTEIRPKNKYTVDDNFFETIDTEEKAYVLGFWYSDGNVSKSEARIRLTITDIEILQKIKVAMKFDGPIREIKPKIQKRKIQYEMSIGSKKLYNDLISKGCVPNKTFVIQFPSPEIVPDHLIHHFIRGYFDGDGSIALGRGKPRSIMIVSTEGFILGLVNKLGLTTENYKIYNRFPERNTNTRSLFLGRKAVVKQFIDKIYHNATIFMQRKRAKVDEFLKANNFI